MMNDEEFLANLKNIDNKKLIQSLQSCGHDGYYNDLYYPIIKEIKRRLSSTSAVSERKTGRWVLWNEPGCEYAKCTACGEMYDQDDLYIGGNDYPKFCPNCDTKMEGES